MDYGYLKLYIDGNLVDAQDGQRHSIICPANEEHVAEVAWSGAKDAELALKVTQKGFKYWSQLSLSQRTHWMLRFRDAVIEKKDKLQASICYEMGKPFAGAAEDIEAIVNALEWYPNAMKHMTEEQISDYENTHRHKMVTQAAGVAVAYLAWNFPILNIGFKLGPALAAGCSIIIKPSEVSPVSAYILGTILHEIGFPPGVVNILCGPPEIVATTLSKSTIPRIVTMIGSTATGKKVIADSSTSIKKLGMELGGNAPFIVFDDADIETALNLAIGLKFGNCGQICVAANRFFIHHVIYDEFLKAYLERVRSLKLGFNIEEDPDMAPLVNQAARERMIEILEDAKAKGANIEFGGGIPEGFKKGYWFEPTVVTKVSEDILVYNQEIFGPVARFVRFKSEEDVIAKANDTEYGLASYHFTNNSRRIERFTRELQFGEIQINGVKYAIYLPHGGIKNSGIGHDCSHLALNDYLVQKRVSISI